MSNIDEGKLKIAEIQPPLATKKHRALPRVWARFYALKLNEVFFVGNDRAIKINGFGFRRFARPSCFVNDWGKQSRFEFIPPWKRVKTDVLVRDARATVCGADVALGYVVTAKGRRVQAEFIDKKPYDPETLQSIPYRGVGRCAPSDFSRDMDLDRPPGASSIQQTGPSA